MSISYSEENLCTSILKNMSCTDDVPIDNQCNYFYLGWVFSVVFVCSHALSSDIWGISITGITPDSVRAETTSVAMSELSLHLDDELFPAMTRMDQQSSSTTFPCPTCQQHDPVPSRGPSDLHSNLDVMSMVETMQKTSVCSMTNPDCSEHPSRSISHVCKTCEVGLCSRCFVSSGLKQHSDHEVQEINETFKGVKTKIDSLAEEGKKACQLLQSELQEKKTAIESCTTDLLSAYISKNLGVFVKLRELSTLLNTTTSSFNKEQKL